MWKKDAIPRLAGGGVGGVMWNTEKAESEAKDSDTHLRPVWGS